MLEVNKSAHDSEMDASENETQIVNRKRRLLASEMLRHPTLVVGTPSVDSLNSEIGELQERLTKRGDDVKTLRESLAPMVAMPALVNLASSVREIRIADTGLTNVTENPVVNPSQAGKVVSQSVKAGTYILLDEIIVIDVANEI